jgi:hypothetical protein
MYKLEKILTAAIFSSLLVATLALADSPMAQDQERGFHKGRGGFKGNERSERPGRVGHGDLKHGGNGCPDGTMRVTFSPDNLSFTILFDQFVADSAADGGRKGAMSCDAILPISLPENQQMEITRVDYRGFVNMPKGGKGDLRSSFNFVDVREHGKDKDRINIRFKFEGPVSENYELSTGDMNNGRGMKDTEVSPCGGDTQLRIHNDAQVRGGKDQPAQLTIDSIDGSSNAVYFVNWKSCQNKPNGRDDRKDDKQRDKHGRENERDHR